MTAPAAKRVVEAGASRLLVDNTVLGHAITHETAWISTGQTMWGGKFPVETGFMARIPVHNELDVEDAARSVRFIPAIASLARQGALKLLTSSELEDEKWTQPMGRFRGYGYYDFNLLGGVDIECLVDPNYSMQIGSSGLHFPSLTDQRRKRLADKQDPLFKDLIKVLGPKNSQDAWHIATAQNNECYCFLTMDFHLLRALHAQRKNSVILSLKTKVLSPEQFGRLFKLPSVSTRLYSYHGASFPVRTEFNWPNSLRRNGGRDAR